MGVRTSMGLESGGWGWGGCSHAHLCLTEVALQLAAITRGVAACTRSSVVQVTEGFRLVGRLFYDGCVAPKLPVLKVKSPDWCTSMNCTHTQRQL